MSRDYLGIPKSKGPLDEALADLDEAIVRSKDTLARCGVYPHGDPALREAYEFEQDAIAVQRTALAVALVLVLNYGSDFYQGLFALTSFHDDSSSVEANRE